MVSRVPVISAHHQILLMRFFGQDLIALVKDELKDGTAKWSFKQSKQAKEKSSNAVLMWSLIVGGVLCVALLVFFMLGGKKESDSDDESDLDTSDDEEENAEAEEEAKKEEEA